MVHQHELSLVLLSCSCSCMRHISFSTFLFISANLQPANIFFLCVCVRLIVDNILQHSSFYLFLHTSTRIIAHERASKKKKILLLFFLLLLRLLTEKRRKGRKKKRARKNNSIADWSRVTVHIKSNYKCSLASSLVLSFSFCEQQPLFFSFFSLYLSRSLSLSSSSCFSFSFFSSSLLCIEKRESAKR